MHLSYPLISLAGSCEIEGQVFQQCKTCPATCSNPNLVCTLQCKQGCGCPSGQLIDDVTDKENPKCVDSKKCPLLPPICAVSTALHITYVCILAVMNEYVRHSK